jgi:hypothetical protein
LVEQRLVLEHGDEGVDLGVDRDLGDHLLEQRLVDPPAREELGRRRVRAHGARGLAGVEGLELHEPRERRRRHVALGRVPAHGASVAAVDLELVPERL